MKKYRILVSAALAILALASCERPEEPAVQVEDPDKTDWNTWTALADCACVKTSLSEDCFTLWDNNDDITIFTDLGYMYMSKKIELTKPTASAEFTFLKIPAESEVVCGVYPADREAFVDRDGMLNSSTNVYQNATPGTFAKNANVAVCALEEDGRELHFNNVCGYVAFDIESDVRFAVTEVKMLATGSMMAGGFRMDPSTLEIQPLGDVSEYVILRGEINYGTKYYLCLLPGVYGGTDDESAHFTITISHNDGTISTVRMANPVTVERNAVTDFGTITESGGTVTPPTPTRDIAPNATVTTGDAANVSFTTATVSGNASSIAGSLIESGFHIGTTASAMNDIIKAGTTRSFQKDLTELQEKTTYYYCAYATVRGLGSYAGTTTTFTGEVKSFTTREKSSSIKVAGWLELPAAYDTKAMASTTSSTLTDLYYITHSVKTERNYTMLYDPEMYAAYWVAYPLCSKHTSGSGRLNFRVDPDIPADKQADLSSGYNTTWNGCNLGRGHQIASADRTGNKEMQGQAYYYTNATPQIQDGFNGSIWNNLENAVRGCIPSGDTLYVVTGAAFRKVGGKETIGSIINKNDGKTLPMANYYWKVLLKVKRSGNTITGASTIGFWLPHKDIRKDKYQTYATSVDQIESFTGFDFFVNLPDSIEESAEANSSWENFTDFR